MQDIWQVTLALSYTAAAFIACAFIMMYIKSFTLQFERHYIISAGECHNIERKLRAKGR
jgi:hypothetical protein